MDPILGYARSHRDRIIHLIQVLVECESPSDNPLALDRFAALISDVVAPLGRIRKHPGGNFSCEFKLNGKRKGGQILALGHFDTVWPMGTLRRMPFRNAKGRLWGPGVLDMKSGIAFFVFAMRAIRELRIPVANRVVLLLNSDEEIGSAGSRALTEELAGKSKAVLVLEPGTGLKGKLKTARKGVGTFDVVVRGRAAHSGIDFSSGASAILELARQIERIAKFTNLSRGITVNPGVIRGGTRSNVIAADARAEVDIRIAKLKDAALLDRKFHTLRPVDKRCTIEISGGLNRPPMERTVGTRALFATASRVAGEIGMSLEESSTGGGSDGNFTSALGIPTLDGLGGVGEGAHAENESILVNRIADRTALLAKLVAGIG
jgi:glutamate carboxypeptidase